MLFCLYLFILVALCFLMKYGKKNGLKYEEYSSKIDVSFFVLGKPISWYFFRILGLDGWCSNAFSHYSGYFQSILNSFLTKSSQGKGKFSVFQR